MLTVEDGAVDVVVVYWPLASGKTAANARQSEVLKSFRVILTETCCMASVGSGSCGNFHVEKTLLVADYERVMYCKCRGGMSQQLISACNNSATFSYCLELG